MSDTRLSGHAFRAETRTCECGTWRAGEGVSERAARQGHAQHKAEQRVLARRSGPPIPVERPLLAMALSALARQAQAPIVPGLSVQPEVEAVRAARAALCLMPHAALELIVDRPHHSVIAQWQDAPDFGLDHFTIAARR